MFNPEDPQSAIRWLAFKNVSGENIGPYKVMKVSGYDTDSGAFTVVKPNADSISPSQLLINGPLPVADQQFGAGSRDYPVLASITAGSAGDQAGTASGTWDLDNTKTGFFLWQTVASGLALVAGAAGGGTGFEIVRITGQFVRDSAEQTGCGGIPSPLCYYPALPQKLTCAGWVDDPSKPAVWVVDWYTYAIIDNGTLPWTVVFVDGTAAVSARDMGFAYAPTDTVSVPTPAHSGESRRVYATTEFAAMWAIQCGGSPAQPQGTLGG